MVAVGYTLSSEEHHPRQLIANARRAEELGFDFLSISDHFHPWLPAQGNSGFVWGTIGGIAASTERIPLAVGVTCPTVRMHPAIVAHASATAAALLPGRFWQGVGTGEALNEHVTGARWPRIETRLAMLEEAVEIMRLLWEGDTVDYDGRFYTVENARLYTVPDEPVPVYVSAFGPSAAGVAARIGDGLWSTSPTSDIIDTYASAGGTGPRLAQLTICYGTSEEEQAELAARQWGNTAVPGQLSQDLPTPTHFEQACQLVTPEQVAEKVPCGPDVERVAETFQKYVDAGYDHIHVHQIGPDQDGFFGWWEDELAPKLR